MKEYKEKVDVIVVGGGHSGMMTAGRAAERGRKVLLIEKNTRLGEKLRISGNGRCNITNAQFDTQLLSQAFGDASKFLHSLFAQFSAKDTFKFFESRGLPLVVEENNRAFPKSQKAEDVCIAMEKYMKDHDVTVLTNKPVSNVEVVDTKVVGVVVDEMLYTADNYVIATGGVSHPETGSTGDGFKWIQALGHTVAKPTPGLVPLKVQEKWVKYVSGVSLDYMRILFTVDGKRRFTKKGRLLFTHFGISGPLIINSSLQVKDLLEEGVVEAHIDMFPVMDHGALEKHVLAMFNEHKNKDFKTVFKKIAPSGMFEVLMNMLNEVVPETKVHSVSREGRKEVVNLLKDLKLTISGLMGYEMAVISDGGVVLSEVDTKTMQSKLFSNLYFTGDLLHINRPTGGFSLQLCWTTGFVAGENV